MKAGSVNLFKQFWVAVRHYAHPLAGDPAISFDTIERFFCPFVACCLTPSVVISALI
ncbi:hypothetical protein SAMN05446927_0127 [Caballeronia arationis]|uniref:Uncharacterized protein n=1 Tax=Caballeronia arationis TaxID=1777142 RepID=A0A7Z7N0J8_9BURK|nr:hypothetical protein SAMN05446927_0127 [Caballeronia arationis]